MSPMRTGLCQAFMSEGYHVQFVDEFSGHWFSVPPQPSSSRMGKGVSFIVSLIIAIFPSLDAFPCSSELKSISPSSPQSSDRHF